MSPLQRLVAMLNKQQTRDHSEHRVTSEMALLQSLCKGKAGSLDQSLFQGVSVFGFKRGFSQLIDRLAYALKLMNNVKVFTNSAVKYITHSDNASSLHVNISILQHNIIAHRHVASG
jgi:hypothetical protein